MPVLMRLLLAVLLLPVLTACADDAADNGPEDALRLQLINAQPGQVIEIPAGRYDFTRTLRLVADNVILRGAGADKTVLSFAGQVSGGEGLLITGNNVTAEHFAVLDAKADGIKFNAVTGATMRHLKVSWSAGPSPRNGAYGLYPVQSRNVLVEHCEVSGTIDAGIYVGQTRHAIVRHNHVHGNVIGIEVENSQHVDVHDNVATDNTAGILLMRVPELPSKFGDHYRVFNNKLQGNNLDNFAPGGNIVAMVPSGTGIMVWAGSDIDIRNNQLDGHRSFNLLLLSFSASGRKTFDLQFNPWMERVMVAGNRFGDSGYQPGGALVEMLTVKVGTPLPDIVWDGARAKDASSPALCLADNVDAEFVNLDWPNGMQTPSRDAAPHDCLLPALSPVSW